MLSFASSRVAGAMARDGREKSKFRLFAILMGPCGDVGSERREGLLEGATLSVCSVWLGASQRESVNQSMSQRQRVAAVKPRLWVRRTGEMKDLLGCATP